MKLVYCVLLCIVVTLMVTFLPQRTKVLESMEDIFLLDLGSSMRVRIGYDSSNKKFDIKKVSETWRARTDYSQLNETVILYDEINKETEDRINSIFMIDLENYPDKPKLLVNGNNPIALPGGKSFLYNERMATHISIINELWLYDLESMVKEKVVDNAYWNRDSIGLTANSFIYESVLSKSNSADDPLISEMHEVQLKPFIAKKWALSSYIPGAVSPDGTKQVLIHNSRGTLSILDIKSRKIQKLESWSLVLLGKKVIWNTSSDGFMFTRQQFRNVIKISETTSLFYFDLNTNTEHLVIDKATLFSGVAVPERYADVFIEK